MPYEDWMLIGCVLIVNEVHVAFPGGLLRKYFVTENSDPEPCTVRRPLTVAEEDVEEEGEADAD